MCSEVSLTQKLQVYSISSRCGMRNLAVEHNIATFSDLSLTVARRQGRLTRGWY